MRRKDLKLSPERNTSAALRHFRGRRRGKYTEAQIDFCGKAWDSASDIQEIRSSTNTKVSYEAAFQFYRRQLAKLGVESVKEFKSIIRAHQARELRRRQRKQSAAKANTERGRNGIIHAMKPQAKTALSLALAIVGGIAAGMCCNASEWVENSSQTNPRPAAYTVKAYTEGSDPTLLKKRTQHSVATVYQLVPMQDFSQKWTDAKLYAKYGIIKSEQKFIESMIKPME